ncbi:MAG: rare lipoprotein A [Verrucomicrobiales bacterium]|jgi:rare lipoprotein A
MQSRFLPLFIAAFLGSLFSAAAEEGKAAYYSNDLHGRKTASGEVYDKNKLTAAHHNLPFGTEVRVTVVKSKKWVEVRINDRCLAKKGRVIDLSEAAAKEIGLLDLGVAAVKIEVIKPAKDE